MPIVRGGDYGDAVPLPAGSPVVSTDAELRAIVIDRRARGREIPVVGLAGGDLCRTLGGRGDRARLGGPEARTFPVDLGVVVADGVESYFVAHLVVGRVFGGGTVVMQAQWLGDADLGPRSHPGDGRLDVTTGDLPIAQRRLARRRARTGTHLPHPGLRHEQVERLVIESTRPRPVLVDGVSLGRRRRIEVTIEPDALCVVV